MGKTLIPKEIRNDINELFPTILEPKNLFYNLSNELKLPSMNQEVLVSDDNYQKEPRWNISLATLKRLDSITRDWTAMPPSLLHDLPNLSIKEKPLFLEEQDDRCTSSKKEETATTNTFIPRKNLDDFKIIQDCLKKKEAKHHACELENTRFKFD